jgi:hypothetical protein
MNCCMLTGYWHPWWPLALISTAEPRSCVLCGLVQGRALEHPLTAQMSNFPPYYNAASLMHMLQFPVAVDQAAVVAWSALCAALVI